jgi:hypothetical protein
MDGDRFDTFVRTFATRSSRRTILGRTIAVVALVPAFLRSTQARAAPRDKVLTNDVMRVTHLARFARLSERRLEPRRSSLNTGRRLAPPDVPPERRDAGCPVN